MKLNKLINKSYYSSVGYISNENDLNTLESYILYNLPVLKHFKGHIVVTNYSKDLREENTQLWRKYFPDCILMDLEVNRGHSFGIADQENEIIEHCHKNNIDWILKTSHDVIFQMKILDIEIPTSDFYYMNGIGYGGMAKYDFDLKRVENEDFYPQTNFYFIDTSKVDYLYDRAYVDETYGYIHSLTNYNGRIWEYIEGWTCEDFLKQCVERNNLSKYHLVSPKTYRRLLETVKRNVIHDCSHKNIMIDGICHYQYLNNPVMGI